MHLKTKIIAATPLITVIVYLLLGFCADAWHPGWIVFFAIPLVPMILGIDSFMGLYPLIAVIVYLIMGFVWDLWHPGWIIFLTIPVVEIFLPKKKWSSKRKTKFKKIFTYDENDEMED